MDDAIGSEDHAALRSFTQSSPWDSGDEGDVAVLLRRADTLECFGPSLPVR